MEKMTQLRNMLKEGRLIRIAGAHNGLTAKLVEEAGFEGIWSSGFEISTSHAVPDANILTMNDFLQAASEMSNSVSIPVIADCDTGYGNSNNVMHMVRKFESAGVSAVCIEDKTFPKVNSFISGRQELAPIAEFVGKVTAAKNAQQKPDFAVFARVEALIAGWGLQEALTRARAYADAGADGIFIHSKSKDPKEIMDFCKAWKKRAPLLICPTTYRLDEKDMKKLGIRVVIYANQGIRASIKHAREVLKDIRERGCVDIESEIVPMEEVFRLQGMHIMKQNEKKYLKTQNGTIKAVIPAAGAKMDSSFEEILADRPVGMLDINGKSLLQRNIDTLNSSGVQDINVVVGYRGEKVEVEGADLIRNIQFGSKGIMHSIVKGMDSLADKNIIAYSDIIFDRHLLQKLIEKEGDILLVADSTYKKMNFRNKELELIAAKYPPDGGARTVDTNRKNPICNIGKDLSERSAHFEFVGLALLSRKGMERLIDAYKTAKLPEPVSFAHLVQYLIKKGHEVLVHEVTSGWMEIHNFSDYKKACSMFSAVTQ